MKEFNERTKKVLCAIIQSYIDLNVPVGSFMVKRRFSFGLSPATIRSTMAGLEDLGYLTQPHTSAGRIPTMMGYRYYVDSLLMKNNMNINSVLLHKLYKRLRGIQKNLNVMVIETSRTLSFYSNCIGIVTPPKAEEKVLKHIVAETGGKLLSPDYKPGLLDALSPWNVEYVLNTETGMRTVRSNYITLTMAPYGPFSEMIDASEIWKDAEKE